MFTIGKFVEMESRLVVAQGSVLGETEECLLVGVGFLTGIVGVFWN